MDIVAYTKLEDIIENYGLYYLMNETTNEKPLVIQEASTYYL
ncbi:MAG: hypothetical protein H7Y00_06550 [Fimbriimonadaceae bacterium]|nr:hypothetical protein [Chitinophagales bacterium]